MNHFCFDIETVPFDSDVLALVIPPFDESEVKTGNLGPEKAAEKIEKLRKEHFERAFKKAALSALTGTVAAIGVVGPELADQSIMEITAPNNPQFLNHLPQINEATLIDWFFRFYSAHKPAYWCGFCINSFDIPFLVRRAWALGLEVPLKFRNGRYLGSDFIDLAELWKLTDRKSEPIGLGELARFVGAGEKKDSGANFHELLRYSPDQATDYLRNDLVLTWKIAHALNAFPPNEPVSASTEQNGQAQTGTGSQSLSSESEPEVIRFW